MSAQTVAFEPITLGPLKLRNRFIKSATNEAMSRDGRPTRALVKFHQDLAAGGVGMTTVAYMAVTKVGRTLEDQVWMRREILPDLRVLTGAVHAERGAVCAQITHGGSFVTGIKVKGRAISASSGLNAAGMLAGNFLQRAMNEQDMKQVVDEFVTAAKIAREAGFDAVELHMGHGYLLNQFISPLSNKRKDQYGGSAENRMRFPVRVLSAVKEAVGKDLAVLAKINVADGVRGGAQVEDAIVTARELQAAGADMLVLSGGRNVESTFFMFGSNMNLDEFIKVLKDDWLSLWALKIASKRAPQVSFRELYLLEYSRAIRAAVEIPLAYLGGAKSMANIEQLMEEGFDCIAMARALVHEPALVNKLATGELSGSGCDSCNGCVAYIYHPGGLRCVHHAQNSLTLNSIPAAQIS